MNLDQAIDRWTETILPSKEEFLEALQAKKLTIYHGIDPTGPELHLGHTTNLFLMRALQDAGHKVILLIGDFTGMIGDPTGKVSTRKQLTKKQVRDNAKNYKEQAGKIIKFDGPNPARLEYNSKWLSKITLEEWFRLASLITYQQLIERDMFQERQRKGQDIFMHEFFYPLMQGYDSVAMNVDAEIGGTDQTFNMLVGRRLMKRLKRKKKFVVTTPLLINPKTDKKLMNKSEGTRIALNDSSNDMYGKVMSLPDEVVGAVFKLCTTVQDSELQSIKHPMESKKRLAQEIAKLYHGEEEAKKAQAHFERVFQKRETPRGSSIRVHIAKKGTVKIVDLLIESGMAESRSEARRLIGQGAVEWGGEKVSDPDLSISKSGILRVGKHRMLKVKL